MAPALPPLGERVRLETRSELNASRLLFVLGALAVSGLACTAILDTDIEQCRVDADCAARGFADRVCRDNVCQAPVAQTDAGGDANVDAGITDPRWACLGKVKWESQINAERIRWRRRYVRFIGEQPLVGLTVRACDRLDLPCSAPLDTKITDANGYVDLDVPRWFGGFLDLPSATSYPEMLPSIESITPPPSEASPENQELPIFSSAHMVSVSELNILLAQIKQELDPNLGHVLGIALDCQGNAASGVEIRPDVRDSKTQTYYTDTTGTPSVTAQTSSQRGELGFVNSATGPVTIQTRVILNDVAIPMGRYTTFVRKGFISFVTMSPTPL